MSVFDWSCRQDCTAIEYMNNEVDQLSAQLRAPQASAAQRKAALQGLAEILEQDYILNLPPQKPILLALSALQKRVKFSPSLKAEAKRLERQYQI